MFLLAELDELCRYLPWRRGSSHVLCTALGRNLSENPMKVATSLLLSGALSFIVSPGIAQSPTVPRSPQAIDPIYTLPPASLSTEQISTLQKLGADWPQLGRYRDENVKLAPTETGESRIIFMGDSITDSWGRNVPAPFFPGKPYINRGISGQTTGQMLVRFRQDVIDLSPAAVVILAGTNDLAGNTGLSSLQMIEDNLQSMCESAKAHGIRVILASVLPVSDYPWRRGLHPAAEIRQLNDWIKLYAQSNGFVYLDYYSAMTNDQGGLDAAVSLDGVHPNAAGYAIMAPLAEKAIQQTVNQTTVPTIAK
jgi:lysophospholipase L1-like esterase